MEQNKKNNNEQLTKDEIIASMEESFKLIYSKMETLHYVCEEIKDDVRALDKKKVDTSEIITGLAVLENGLVETGLAISYILGDDIDTMEVMGKDE
jgi:transcriptional regulator NrdR family protein